MTILGNSFFCTNVKIIKSGAWSSNWKCIKLLHGVWEAPRPRRSGPGRAASLLLRASFCAFSESLFPPPGLCLPLPGNPDAFCRFCQRGEENTSLTSISRHFISSKRKTIDFRELIFCQAISPKWCLRLFLSQCWRFVFSESVGRGVQIPTLLLSSCAEASLLKHVCVNLARLH